MRNWIIGVFRAILFMVFFSSVLLTIYNLKTWVEGSDLYVTTVEMIVCVISLIAIIWSLRKEKYSLGEIVIRGIVLLFFLFVSLIAIAVLASSHIIPLGTKIEYAITYFVFFAMVSYLFTPKR